jgi:MFS family permease
MAFGIIFYVLLGRRAETSTAQPVAGHLPGETLAVPGRWRRLVAIIVVNTFAQAVTFAVIAFIPLFLVDHFSIGEETAAAFLAIVYSAGLWASPLGGYLSDRLGRVPVILVTCLIAGPVIYLLNLVPYGLGIGALLIIIGMVMYIRMPASEAYVIGQTPERYRSTILGIYYFSSMEAGGLLTPVMGSLIDQLGFYPSFSIASVAVVAVTLACSVFLWGSRD